MSNSDYRHQLISELAKKYTYETFDFTNGSPEEFYALYEKTYNAIEQVNPADCTIQSI